MERMFSFRLLDAGYRGEIGPDELVARDWRRHLYRYLWALEQITPGSRVLDAACGSGYGSQMLAGKAESVVGVDYAQIAIDAAQRVYQAPNARFVQADYRAFHEGPFDYLVSFETLEHLEDPVEFLRLAAQEWIPGGVLLLSVPAYNDLDVNPHHHYFFPPLLLKKLITLYFHIEAVFGQRDDGRVVAGGSTECSFLVRARAIS